MFTDDCIPPYRWLIANQHAQVETARESDAWMDAMLRLCAHLEEHVCDWVREQHAEDPQNWWVPYHFAFGLEIRNMLRDNGLKADAFGITNLDDIWVELVEEAAGVGEIE
jgi:hypothetical protein